VPPLFDQILDTGGNVLDNNYKTPYGIQMNIGVQYELKPGLVLTADYVRNRGVHFNQTINRNRIGAADSLNVPAAQSAMAATFNKFACNIATTSQNVDCMIAKGRSISDFADNGLGAGSGVDGFVFSGGTANFRGIGIISPIGLSLYQAFAGPAARRRWTLGPFKHVTTNITYALGRFESTGTDQTFCRDQPSMTGRRILRSGQRRPAAPVWLEFPRGSTVGLQANAATRVKSFFGQLAFPSVVYRRADEIFFSDLDGDG